MRKKKDRLSYYKFKKFDKVKTKYPWIAIIAGIGMIWLIIMAYSNGGMP